MYCLKELCPAPESFRTRIYSGANTKSTLISSIDDHSIEKERLASSILSSHTYDTDRLLYSLKKFSCFITHDIRSLLLVILDHMNWLPALNNVIYPGGQLGAIIDSICWLSCVLL